MPNECTNPPRPMLATGVVIAATALTHWLVMMAVHEGGHAIGARLTGGHITRVVLTPLALSRTDVSPNPAPLTVAWCGPLIGALAPAAVCALLALAQRNPGRWLRAFAGFCLVVNGLYLASGAVAPAGDTQDLLQLGSPPALLAAAGLPLAAAGLWMWHRLGPLWGIAGAPAADLRRWGWMSVGALCAVAGAMLAVSAAQ
ncbi:MAG TPA: hypothetical protein VFF65_06635 [Phycisphaerales bacterium]|nr:hypothetical protein [Phycisphaerales bacterium]